MGAQAPQSGEIYLQFQQIGKAIKVIAVDAVTGTEVAVMGPTSASQSDLAALAVRKLETRLRKERGEPRAIKGRGQLA
ncbi:MAG: DUF6898 family protein [Methyloligellaceae bacterium]